MLTWLTIVAAGGIAALAFTFRYYAGAARFEALASKRRASSRIVTNGEFVDGSRHLRVVLALTSTSLYYENSDMEASLDLQWISEVEYDTSLATGHTIGDRQVLRIRCFSQVFEFALPSEAVARWRELLPARHALASPEGTTLAAPMVTA